MSQTCHAIRGRALGKTCYTKALAKQEIRKRMSRGAPALTTYRCSVCGHWHLTKQTSHQRKQARKSKPSNPQFRPNKMPCLA